MVDPARAVVLFNKLNNTAELVDMVAEDRSMAGALTRRRALSLGAAAAGLPGVAIAQAPAKGAVLAPDTDDDMGGEEEEGVARARRRAVSVAGVTGGFP